MHDFATFKIGGLSFGFFLMTKTITLQDSRGRCLVRWLRLLTLYAFLAFCIWLSQGSTWWTFITGTLFILSFFSMAVHASNKGKTDFHSLDELQAWIDRERAVEEVRASSGRPPIMEGD